MQEELALEGLPRRLFGATPSRLATWLDCPRRYRMTYLDRPPLQKGPPWAHNSVGSSAHNALREWFMLPVARRTPEQAAALVDRHFLRDGFRDDAQAEEWRERTRAMVAGYAATLDPETEPIGLERTVSTRTDVLALSGRVDRIDDRDGQLVIVDYKTGRTRLTEADARSSLALAIYAVAAARTLRKPCVRVELHHLPTGDVLAWEHTGEALERQIRRADAIGAEAQAAEQQVKDGAPADDALFPPQPGPLCSWCDFAQHCPEGRAVAAVKKPWDGLAGADAVLVTD
ncbi:MAG: putative RecB family exonuclease [Frankiales bacterium]|nr:putative RecB family exonuclease [Frankiales bacterium]